MPVREHLRPEFPRDADWLGDYRAAIDRLREETARELGGPPMPPEAFAMLATVVAVLQLTALMLPSIPFEPAIWQVALVLVLVWTASFRLQHSRYARFQERWDRKVLAHARSLAPPEAEVRFLRRR